MQSLSLLPNTVILHYDSAHRILPAFLAPAVATNSNQESTVWSSAPGQPSSIIICSSFPNGALQHGAALYRTHNRGLPQNLVEVHEFAPDC